MVGVWVVGVWDGLVGVVDGEKWERKKALLGDGSGIER